MHEESRSEEKNNRRWVRLISLGLGILLIAVALLLIQSGRNSTATDSDVIIIRVSDQEYARIPVGERQKVTITQEDGAVNVVEITEKGAVMHSSTCENQLCVHMGEVTVDNWEFRPNGAFIVCLPNRVSVELAVKQ